MYSNPKFLNAAPLQLLEVYKNGILPNGKKLHSETKPNECMYLMNLINKYNLKKSLEIGMAYGISAAWINKYTKNHTCIDPFQEAQWDNMGKKLNPKVKLIEEVSYLAFPQLIEEEFDLIYIDGFHTFDYTLIDIFYADKLLKIGGFVIIDDVKLKGVNECVNYIKKNYKHFKPIPSPSTQACFRKIAEDLRLSDPQGWKHHR